MIYYIIMYKAYDENSDKIHQKHFWKSKTVWLDRPKSTELSVMCMKIVRYDLYSWNLVVFFQINYIFDFIPIAFKILDKNSPAKTFKKCFLRSNLEILKIFTISEIECGKICCCQINM